MATYGFFKDPNTKYIHFCQLFATGRANTRISRTRLNGIEFDKEKTELVQTSRVSKIIKGEKHILSFLKQRETILKEIVGNLSKFESVTDIRKHDLGFDIEVLKDEKYTNDLEIVLNGLSCIQNKYIFLEGNKKEVDNKVIILIRVNKTLIIKENENALCS